MVENFEFDRWMFKLRKLFPDRLPSTIDWYELWEKDISPEEAKNEFEEFIKLGLDNNE